MFVSNDEANLTLLIRHLPREFSDDDKLEFLQHFGAVSVKCVCSGGKKNEVVFAKFSSQSVAKAAVQRLHQLEVLGCHLVVEYAHSSSLAYVEPGTSTADKIEARPDESKRQRLQDQFMRRLVSWSTRLNLSQPPPSHLCYQYPPPTPATLSNISRALSMYPRLYTQLLHLMNRMNLPPPFQDSFYHKSTTDQTTQTDKTMIQDSSSESEMESEGEQAQGPIDVLQPKRALHRRNIKPIKRPRFIKPSVPSENTSASVSMRPEEVFEKTETELHPKKIRVCLTSSLPMEKEESGALSEVADPGGFGTIHPPEKPHERSNDEEIMSDQLEEDKVITLEQLAANRIPEKDLQVLPVFKNYSPGVPSCRLYVKNVSKHAVPKDLYFIYGRFSRSSDGQNNINETSMYDVRLMTEGRMKGQAFVTLPSIKLAQEALQETNGFILKDKPLVVQFARSAPAPAGTPSTS